MGRYEEAFKALNSAQKQAVETIDGPVLVIAGPGTGKTQLLTTRIAHILAKTDTLPQNILCLTFTESAAQTMRERLSSMIGQGAYDVTISTYHAFGSDLIRRFPDYFAEQADLRPVDDLTIDRVLREIITSLPYSNPLKYSDAYLSDLKTLISDAKRALLTPDDLRMVAKHNLQYIQQTNPIVSQSLGAITRIDKKALPLFARLAKDLPKTDTAKKPHGSVLSLAELLHTALAEALESAEISGKTTDITAWKNTWLARDAEGHFVIDGTKANQKLLAAADVYDNYLSELKTRELFDYDDMILRAVHALEANNDLRFTLQEQYQYILLDEFQDTNGAQLRLVELLTDNPVNEGRPNVLAVGDDDQAIYAFQGANYSHMLQFKDMYQGVVVIPLTENYRSHPDILHTARGIAEQIEVRLHHHFPAIEKTLTAAGKELPKKAVVERRDAQSDVMQYAWVARRITELTAAGIPPSEIVVLAPQHKYLEPLIPFLQQESIPVRYEKREDVLNDPAVNQLLRMSELSLALAHGDHARANALWAEVLSFGFWELPTSLIWRFSWQASDDDRNWTDELLADQQLKPIALFFIRLGFLSGSESLETMLDYIIGVTPLDLSEPGYDTFSSPFYKHYFGDIGELAKTENTEYKNFWSMLTNLIVLRARLREYRGKGDEPLRLADFITFTEAHRDSELKILNTSPYASGHDAIQIMTAFKAKGMEFSAVFLLAVNEEAWGTKARSQSTRISLPPNLQFIRYAGATSDERLRLFYVALTRAKTQLYLVNFTQNYAGKHTTRLKYLNETADEYGGVSSPLLPVGQQLVKPAEDGVPEPTTELAAYWRQRHENALSHADMQALLHERLGQFQLSPTHVNDFIDVAHCGPQAFFLRTILRFPQTPWPELQFGNAMHETLEWLHNQTKHTGKVPGATQALATFEHCLKRKRLGSHDTKLFSERGRAALRLYLAQRKDTISPSHIVEYSFRNEGVFAGNAHLSGKVDKLIIDKNSREITIVDYKTGKSHSRWSREISLHKYRHQLYLYRALVEGSHTFAGYRVKDAYLEFVEPDEDGRIHELHLVFDDAEYQRVKRLAEAVWQRITQLDLPDITAYSKDLAGLQGFEADLIAT
jgi:DNA helicase II / ATP-dependent DNA helicase PcrA